jgi:hypothetical protein
MGAEMRLRVAALLVVAGCGGTVRSTTAPKADLARYRTYSFVHSPGRVESITEQTLDSSLKHSLAAKGFTEAAPGPPPDFLVRHQLTTQEELYVEPIGYGLNATGDEDVSGYTEGTLIIDFIDPRTKQIFWRGTADDVVNRPASPDTGTISKVVGRIVARYPSTIVAAPRTTM